MVKATNDQPQHAAPSSSYKHPADAGGAAEHSPFRHALDEIRASIPCGQAVILTSLPRGTLQLAQPARVNELLRKRYSRIHAHDRLSWRTMLEQRVVLDEEAWSPQPPADDPFFAQYLIPAGLRHAVAAPLSGPVLEGYPGAIHLYRSSAQGPFSAAEAERLSSLASRVDASSLSLRASRRNGVCCSGHNPWMARPQNRHFILDADLRSHPAGDELDILDARLRDQILEHATHRVQSLNGDAIVSDRLQLPDAVGGYWNFRVITHREYPAIGDGPFIFFCMLPDCCDWSLLRAVDFQADPEMARLVPVLRFMHQQFHRSPSLEEISRQVHLSPFHFHRRFTELLGITPKHFLLDCQIHHAKRELMEGGKELSKIATDCGFAHQSHFTSRFKQATGLTPTRWRRAYSQAR